MLAGVPGGGAGQVHALGDNLFVDYAGPMVPVGDQRTSDVRQEQIFGKIARPWLRRCARSKPRPTRHKQHAALDAFAEGPLCAKYPTIAATRERAWEYALPFFVFPPEVRRVIYITDAIENMNR